MIQQVRGKLTYGNIMSTIALMVALGGTSYAAFKLPANSVGSVQIKRSGVKNSDIAANAVTSGKVRNGSLQAADFASGQLPTGATGARGATGAQGIQGIQGPAGLLGSVVVHLTNVALPAGASAGVAGADTSGFTACAAGEKLIGGSASIGNVTDPPSQEMLVSRPSADNVGSGTVPTEGGSFSYWKGTARTLTNVAGTMRVFAFCAAP